MSDDLDQERHARLALGRIGEPGTAKLSRLVAELGPVVLHRHLHEERGVDGVPTDVAIRLRDVDPAADLARAAQHGIRFVIPGDDEWPAQLDTLAHAESVQGRGGPPLGLWARGPLRLDEVADSVSVVGSRSATTYGADVAGELAAHVGQAGVCVISGAAFGIDQAAHRGALAVRGRTVAVLAGGVDRPYPPAHRDLLAHIAQHGLVVSELAPGCTPTRVRFLIRNRLIAALSRGTVVVEAAARSGAISTANWASRLNRILMAVPGPVTHAQSAGAHELLRTGAASLVTRGADVLELLGASGEHVLEELRGEERLRDRLTPSEAQVLDAVPVTKPVAVDSIARAAGVGLREAHQSLEALAGHGFVRKLRDGWQLTGRARR